MENELGWFFFWQFLLFSATVQKLRMCLLQFSSCFYCFRRKSSSKQYVRGKPPLELVTQLLLVFIPFSALSRLRPRGSCGLKGASISFQLLLNMPSNTCCPLSDCPYNKPVLLERMLPWVWYGGKKAIPEKLAGHRGNLSSSCQEVLQDCASLVSLWLITQLFYKGTFWPQHMFPLSKKQN